VEQVQQMKALMQDALGVGLAATQLGMLNQVLVYRPEPQVEPVALVNPEIEWHSEETEEFSEGCLSLPGIYVTVVRPSQIRVRAQDERGRPLAIEAAGFEADVIQHEIDHLAGLLILDRTTRDQRREAVRALLEGRSFDGTPPSLPLPETPA
jgi:peptide deformylase